MIGKVPYGVAGTSPFLAIGIFIITEFPALGAEVPQFSQADGIVAEVSADR